MEFSKIELMIYQKMVLVFFLLFIFNNANNRFLCSDLPTAVLTWFLCSALSIVVLTGLLCSALPTAVFTGFLCSALHTALALTLNTSCAASAAAIVYLAPNGNSDANCLAICQQFGDFCQQSSGAVVSAFVAVVIFVILILMSASALRKV
ncbi:unnamed protein product [Prunus brigantina]